MYKETQSANEIFERSKKEPVIVYKHSATCGLSARAKMQVDSFVKEFPEVPVFKVVVQEQRDLSNEIEKISGIEHHSPQIIVLKDGKPTENFSHAFINKEKIENAFDRARR